MVLELYYAWCWTPYFLNQMQRSHSSGLILPEMDGYRDESSRDSAIAHFSAFKSGQEYSWIWLFPNQAEAVRLRLLPRWLGDTDPLGTLISATIPPNPPRAPEVTYLQPIPLKWLQMWNLAELGIHEVWVGFNFDRFKACRDLLDVTTRYSVEEFKTLCKRA